MQAVTPLLSRDVAPLTGAWIETLKNLLTHKDDLGRAPRGRVD